MRPPCCVRPQVRRHPTLPKPPGASIHDGGGPSLPHGSSRLVLPDGSIACPAFREKTDRASIRHQMPSHRSPCGRPRRLEPGKEQLIDTCAFRLAGPSCQKNRSACLSSTSPPYFLLQSCIPSASIRWSCWKD